MTDTIKPVAWMHYLPMSDGTWFPITSYQKPTGNAHMLEPLFSGSSLDRAALESAIEAVEFVRDLQSTHAGEVARRNEIIAHLTALLGVATQEK